MNQRSLLVQLAVGLSLLCITLPLFELTRIDLWVQDKFYISGAASWVIGKQDELLRAFFYTGPKAALKVLAGLALLAVIFSRKIPWVHNRKEGMLIVLLSTVVTVTLVGFLKGATDVPCPSQLALYDGNYPYSTFWAHLLSPEQAARARCFPAGHASGGFALLSLAFLFRSRKNRWIGFGIGMALGWTLGIYKMAIGDHFLSHTLVTMCLAWIVTVLVAMAVFHLYERLPAGTAGNSHQSP